MSGKIRVALIAPTETGYGVRIALEDCPIIEHEDDKLLPYLDMTTDQALPICDAMFGMLIQAICLNAK
jgi:hypothetical protein